MNGPLLASTLRSLGLKPTEKRLTLLRLFYDDTTSSFSSDAIYRQLIALGTPLKTSCIAHALVDYERVGLLERTVGVDRRSYFRYRHRGGISSNLPVYLKAGNTRTRVQDTILLERLRGLLADGLTNPPDWPPGSSAIEIAVVNEPERANGAPEDGSMVADPHPVPALTSGSMGTRTGSATCADRRSRSVLSE